MAVRCIPPASHIISRFALYFLCRLFRADVLTGKAAKSIRHCNTKRNELSGLPFYFSTHNMSPLFDLFLTCELMCARSKVIGHSQPWVSLSLQITTPASHHSADCLRNPALPPFQNTTPLLESSLSSLGLLTRIPRALCQCLCFSCVHRFQVRRRQTASLPAVSDGGGVATGRRRRLAPRDRESPEEARVTKHAGLLNTARPSRRANRRDRGANSHVGRHPVP